MCRKKKNEVPSFVVIIYSTTSPDFSPFFLFPFSSLLAFTADGFLNLFPFLFFFFRFLAVLCFPTLSQATV
uniref:Uncharacterized protein n=1 Tax=Rhizophora mucronata TaxID=61149 RepID=A0A2P2KNB1_RHIMU